MAAHPSQSSSSHNPQKLQTDVQADIQPEGQQKAQVFWAGDSPETATAIKALQKENRILHKKLERANAELQHMERTKRNQESLLKTVISELQESQQVLERKGHDLEITLEQLRNTQEQLVESEKLSALGQLVAGVAHEINTPVGTSITLASTLADETSLFLQRRARGGRKTSQRMSYAAIAQESSQLILSNLRRAGDLIQNFKQVAVDQSHLEQRSFALKAYSKQVFQSLSPQLHHHQWQVTGDELTLHSYPGLLAQVLTNLITNSLAHAYAPGESGQLSLAITQCDNNEVELCYGDQGRGMTPEVMQRIYEPFFTTARHRGGTGLGMHILYNLITQHLHGHIQLQSELGHGSSFTIRFPITPEATP